MTDIMLQDTGKMMQYYINLKKSQEKYRKSEKGMEKARIARRTYYNKMKENDPNYLSIMNERKKAAYHKKKNELDVKTMLPIL
jgi:hypothetical protein